MPICVASERRLNASASYASGNVDESGNFSVQVLRSAVQRSHGLDLLSWSSEAGRGTKDPTEENGFIVNAHGERAYLLYIDRAELNFQCIDSDHWFSIRQINMQWWDLNSTLDKPGYISNFYLSALLSQYREEGCTVFLVVGNLPPCGVKSDFTSAMNPEAMSRWYRVCDLLPGQQKKEVSSVGRRLGTAEEDNATEGMAREVIDLIDSEADGDEDLKQALLLSMNEHNKTVDKRSEKEIMREKRLKMLERSSAPK